MDISRYNTIKLLLKSNPKILNRLVNR